MLCPMSWTLFPKTPAKGMSESATYVIEYQTNNGWFDTGQVQRQRVRGWKSAELARKALRESGNTVFGVRKQGWFR